MSKDRDCIELLPTPGGQITRREFLKLTGMFALSFLAPRSPLGFEKAPLLPEVVRKIETEDPYFALTIDDGWSPEVLRDMLGLLASKGVKADFFLVGVAAKNCEERMPGLLKRLAEEGHKIGYHTMHHNEKSLNMSVDELRKDFELWKQTFVDIVGDQLFEESFSGCARAVGGHFYPAFLSFCAESNLLPCGWSITPTPDTFRKGYKINRGDIVLYHVRGSDLDYLKWLLGLSESIGLKGTDIDSLISMSERPIGDKGMERRAR